MSPLFDWIHNNLSAHGPFGHGVTWNMWTIKSILPILGGWHCCCYIVLDVRFTIFAFKVKFMITLAFITVTYGAITVLQVMGYDDGMRLLERTQPLALVVGLPSIPATLILSQFFRWDDILLKCIGKEPYSNRPWAWTFSFLNLKFTTNIPQTNRGFVITFHTKWYIHHSVRSANFMFCTTVANSFNNRRKSI